MKETSSEEEYKGERTFKKMEDNIKKPGGNLKLANEDNSLRNKAIKCFEKLINNYLTLQ